MASTSPSTRHVIAKDVSSASTRNCEMTLSKLFRKNRCRPLKSTFVNTIIWHSLPAQVTQYDDYSASILIFTSRLWNSWSQTSLSCQSEKMSKASACTWVRSLELKDVQHVGNGITTSTRNGILSISFNSVKPTRWYFTLLQEPLM